MEAGGIARGRAAFLPRMPRLGSAPSAEPGLVIERCQPLLYLALVWKAANVMLGEDELAVGDNVELPGLAGGKLDLKP
jgi:hypothetical protein